MIEKLWFERHLSYFLLWPLLWPLSLVFKLISSARRRAFQQGKKASYKAPVPVFVVGNITAGGNGKTPFVIWLVETLQRQGYRAGVVSRGYGGKAPVYPLLVTESTPTSHCGDEPKLIYQRTHAPVAVDPVRVNAVKALLALGVEVIVTDDGLQHYALEREIEFAVVDGVRRFGNQQLIPLGPLREPVSRLQEVDFIITNGGQAKTGEIGMTLSPSLAVNLVTGERVDVSQLTDLVAWAGIGHPERFFKTLQTLGAKPIVTHGFADHQAFDESQLKVLAKKGDNVIMTEKDAVKCTEFAEANWWYLPVSAQIVSEHEQCILKTIKEVMELYGSSSA
ncbi:tetraacyldisaccharide 4'-kinase [Vibrio sp. V27_P1S3P104]|uniref:tetraacyldisaccharide 4'-kinase n=1 Tax=Vibrio TaxID=662 RepID=UPI000C16FC55|nr:tetraacyldisaccharide 4'-kinase [Vibrio fujianensis]NAW68678.1 tetraacyldisaccharide 4'-kinase [Vibrio sp. V28_P6S34P95]NAX04384.1 tetraacyldisaccharide 4'-kinase [Vibrio sp. V30_P3S12P165]NAX33133.1 tetraacyldisaccharide 4'-kinase [Vibrio sp. V29_P1S30P107]NAX36931.1 tetraacyldisaccharide 4'-kinase [Vibrio sp. V27_P1S3P104]NAX40796.1 tetraacyldisaccharide 4'-kinase [Vibrio sp. V26_P1S5P106]NNN44050.1 tetraacyldisaccharide 4'-kinase [Vibrio sp. 1-1(7)]NNN71874.1 tetraacyldisaccharide 4'-k